ncbi:hypothetical protein RUND412_002987 [Rhizina undulata]
MAASPPLTGLLVLEFAGLAPGPFAGKLLADYGANVLRIDRHNSPPDSPAPDLLAENKRSITVNLKSPQGVALVRKLSKTADVVIDPFRPGVLERLGLGPEELMARNGKLVYARMSGFRRDGKYKDMAGHDITVSGALSLLGRAHEKPYPPANILGDFAGGGAMCFMGILLALLNRAQTGKGQVVEANMVDGSAYLTSFPRYLLKTSRWGAKRGKNLLDGGAPFYDTYETKDGGFMAVGALEPQFYAAFVSGLFRYSDTKVEDLPERSDHRNWKELADVFTKRFLEKTRREWEAVFDGTDACVTPVKSHAELEQEGFDQRPAVTLRGSPAVKVDGWNGVSLKPGNGGKGALEEWWGWREGVHWRTGSEGSELLGSKAKL